MGSWLALERLQRDRALTPQERATFRRSADELLLRQRASVTRGFVTHCGVQTCRQRWEDLEPSRDTTRACAACRQPVTFTDVPDGPLYGMLNPVMLDPAWWTEAQADHDRHWRASE